MASVDNIENPGFEPRVPDPISGTIHPLFLLGKFAKNPLSVWADFQFEVPRHTFRYFGLEATLLNDPEDISQVFIKNADKLRQETIRQRMIKPLLGNGLLAAEGPQWHVAKGILCQRMSENSVPDIALQAGRVAGECFERMVGQAADIRVADALESVALKILSVTMLSDALEPFRDDILRELRAYFRYYGKPPIADLLGWSPRFPRFSQMRGRPHRNKLRKIAAEIVSARRARTEIRGDGDRDILDVLIEQQRELGLADHFVEDNLLSFIVTGHETLARVLAWTVFLLAKSPQTVDAIRAELDNVRHAPSDTPGAKSALLDAVIKETLRLYPPGPIISRQLSDAIALETTDLRRGSIVFINTWILHRHTRLWDQPSKFRPSRFLADGADVIVPLSYLPFGLGSRACVGSRLALAQASEVLKEVITQFDFQYLPARDPTPMLNITLQPDNGIPVRFERR